MPTPEVTHRGPGSQWTVVILFWSHHVQFFLEDTRPEAPHTGSLGSFRGGPLVHLSSYNYTNKCEHPLGLFGETSPHTNASQATAWLSGKGRIRVHNHKNPWNPPTNLSPHFQSKCKGVTLANDSKQNRVLPEAQTPQLHFWLRLDTLKEGQRNSMDLSKSVKPESIILSCWGTNTTNDI